MYISAQDMGNKLPPDLPNVNDASLEDSNEVSLVKHVETSPIVSTSPSGGVLDSERSILNQNIEDVEAILKEMVRLTFAIRKTGPPSRFQKADDQFDPDAHQDLKVRLQDILMGYNSEKRASQSQLESLQLSEIQWRLIEANLRRRNRFLYQQIHSKKLAIKDTRPPQNIKREEKSFHVKQDVNKLRIFLSSIFHRKRKLLPQPHSMEASQPGPSAENLTTTSASRIQGNVRIVKQPPTTMVLSTATGADYPNPPELASGQQLFKCPCCYQCLGREYTQKNKWRFAHQFALFSATIADSEAPESILLRTSNLTPAFWRIVQSHGISSRIESLG